MAVEEPSLPWVAWPSNHGVMRRILLLALASALNLGFGPPVLTSSEGQGSALSPYQIREIGKLAPPQVKARAAILADAASGRVLYEKNARRRISIASTTKIVTAIVAIERGNLNDQVTVKRDVVVEGSTMGLWPGSTVTLETLLYGLMHFSGNDAAVAIAEHVGGSVESFVAMMNEKAKSLGLEDTYFSNPHGLDQEGHYSSAYDLMQLTRYAMGNPVFVRIVGTRQVTVGGRTFVNSNHLLWQYAGADGVKTGITDLAGESLVASATRGGHRLLALAMNSSDRYGDATALLDLGFNSYRWLPLMLAENALARFPRSDGKWALAYTEGQHLVALASWEEPLLHRFLELSPSDAWADDGSPAGAAHFFVGESLVLRLPAFAVSYDF